jgi:hypothetical protein
MIDKMKYRGTLIKVIATIIIIILGIYVAINLPLSTKSEEKKLFPGIIGDAILKNNETGISSIKDVILYDDFRGDIIQGYKANYSGSNGTIIIFIAQMQNYSVTDKSLKDMVIRAGYNESDINATLGKNTTIIKLPVKNPEVFVIQKDENTTWHYVYVKLDKVYWVGFSKPDVDYQASMLVDIYRKVDNE